MTPALAQQPPKDDLQRRRPVWEALSTLFLDTDTSLDRQRRAQVLAASEYSLGELEEILLTEVYPACAINLRSPAGEWAGFDSEWLEERILSRPPSRIHRFTPGRLLFSREWRRTKAEIRSYRASIPPQVI